MITRTIVHGLVAAGVIAGAGMAWADIGASGLNTGRDTTVTKITVPASLPDAADALLVLAAADTGYRAAQASATQRGQRARDDDDRWEERREERRDSHREDREHGRRGMNSGMTGGMTGSMSGTGYRANAGGTCDDCTGGRDDD